MAAPVRARRALAGRRAGAARLQRRAVLPRARRGRRRRATTTTAFELALECSLDDARAHFADLDVAWDEREGSLFLSDPDGRLVQVMPYRVPASEADRRPQHARPSTTVHLGGARKLGHVNCLTADIQAGRPVLRRRSRDARLRLARRGRGLVPRQLRPPRDGARRPRLRALPPPRVRHGRHREDARHARPPRPPRALARLGAGPPRDRGEHRELRPDRRGGVLRRALLRHGAAPGRPRAARLPGRPLLVEHVGAAAAALVLPLRPGRDRVRAGEPRDARPRPAAAGGPVSDAAPRLHDPALARGALLARPVPAVALRRRLPRRRVLGRPGEGRLVPAGRHGSAPRSGPLRLRLRRLAVVLVGRRRAARSLALAVQGGVRRRQRAARRRGGDDVPVHLGRPRLRAHPRLAAGLPEEARLDLDHAHLRPRQPGRPRRQGRAPRSAPPAPPTSAASRRRR